MANIEALFIICCIAVYLNGVLSDCSATDVFTPVPENEYDRTYSPITDDDARPLGFKKGTVVFGEKLCVSISGLQPSSQSVEVMFETDPVMRLCYKEISSGTVECAEQRSSYCTSAAAETLNYEFYCSVAEGCSESDITFWYRITKGTENDADNMWCQYRDSEFPSDLLEIPANVDIPEAPADDPSNSATTSYANLAVMLATLLITLL